MGFSLYYLHSFCLRCHLARPPNPPTPSLTLAFRVQGVSIMSVMQQPGANIPILVFTSILYFSSLNIAAEERLGWGWGGWVRVFVCGGGGGGGSGSRRDLWDE